MARFLLDLRAKSVHPNGEPNAQVSQLSTLHVVMTHIHAAIAEEFQDPLYHTTYMETRAWRDGQDVALEDFGVYDDATITADAVEADVVSVA